MKRKPWSEYTERQKESYRICVSVLKGSTFQEAADKHGLNSRHAAMKRFRSTVGNLFFQSMEQDVKDNLNDIKYLRRKWANIKVL